MSQSTSNTSDPGRIESDLDQTRARLDSHLSELQDRLSPGQVLDDLMGYFRGSEGADFGRNLLDSVRANPLPAAITGIGLAWLMAANPHPGQGAAVPSGRGRVRVSGAPGGVETTYDAQGHYDAMQMRVRTAEQGVVRQPGEAEHAYTDRLNQARGQALGIARSAQDTAQSFGQRIQDALAAAAEAVTHGAHGLRDQVSGAAGQLGSSVSQLGSSAQGAASQLGSQIGGGFAHGGQAAQRMGGSLVAALSDSPVLLGALGLAAGALLGALVPQSEQEEAALGGIAGQAREAFRGAAQEAVDRGGSVAQAVLDAGRSSVQQHGLTGDRSPGALVDAALSGDLATEAKQVAKEVLQAGDEAVRKKGLGQQEGPKT